MTTAIRVEDVLESLFRAEALKQSAPPTGHSTAQVKDRDHQDRWVFEADRPAVEWYDTCETICALLPDAVTLRRELNRLLADWHRLAAVAEAGAEQRDEEDGHTTATSLRPAAWLARLVCVFTLWARLQAFEEDEESAPHCREEKDCVSVSFHCVLLFLVRLQEAAMTTEPNSSAWMSERLPSSSSTTTTNRSSRLEAAENADVVSGDKKSVELLKALLHDHHSAFTRALIHGMAIVMVEQGGAAHGESLKCCGAGSGVPQWVEAALRTLVSRGKCAETTPSTPTGRVQMSVTLSTELLAEVTGVLTREVPAPIPLMHGPPTQQSNTGENSKKKGNKTHHTKRGGGGRQRPGESDSAAPAEEPPHTTSSERDNTTEARQKTQQLRYTVLAERILTGVLSALHEGRAALLATEGEGISHLPPDNVSLFPASRPVSELMDLCRRVLLPLLLAYASSPATRLATTSSSGRGGNDRSAVPPGARLEQVDSRVVLPLLQSFAQSGGEEKLEEVVVLIASLFDFLFRGEGNSSCMEESSALAKASHDYRYSDFFWDTLYRALQYAIRGGCSAPSLCLDETAEMEGVLNSNHKDNTQSNQLVLDAGRQMNMQLRVCYLLKRVVHLTSLTHSSASLPKDSASVSALTAFHELFPWDPQRSPDAWNDFILVMETANEFNLHIILPVLKRLDALVEVSLLPRSESERVRSPIHPRWIEILLLKLLRHPNTAVRKLVLRRLWMEWPLEPQRSYANALSLPFLCFDLFSACADPRLCSDLDRLPVSTTFLEMKAFEWEDLPSSPASEPIGASVDRFYSFLMAHRMRSGKERADGLQLLLRAVHLQQSRFSLSIFARAFAAVSVTLYKEALSAATSDKDLSSAEASLTMVLHPTNLRLLTSLFRECVQDNVSFWLEVRLSAILFTALLHLAALHPAKCRTHRDFWRLLSHCGPLAVSGGKVTSQAEGCGYVVHTVSGAGYEPCFLAQYLRDLSLQCRPIFSETSSTLELCGVSVPLPTPTLLHCLLDTPTLYRRTEALLKSSPASLAVHLSSRSAGSATSPSSISLILKEHFFLIGALARRASSDALKLKVVSDDTYAEEYRLLRSIADLLAQQLQQCFNRPYGSPYVFLTACMALVEFCQEVGSALGEAHRRLLFSAATIQTLVEGLEVHAFHVLEASRQELHQWIAALTHLQHSSNSTQRLSESALRQLLEDQTAPSNGEEARWIQPEWWEVLTAGIAALRRFLVEEHSLAAVPEASTASLPPPVAVNRLEDHQREWTLTLLPRLFQLLETLSMKNISTARPSDEGHRIVEQSRTLLVHHTVKWLQCELASVLPCVWPHPASTPVPGDLTPSQEASALPCEAESTPVESSWWYPCALFLRMYHPEQLVAYVRGLMACLDTPMSNPTPTTDGVHEPEGEGRVLPGLHRTSSPSPEHWTLAHVLLAVLPTTVSWKDVFTGLDRAVYNTLYALCPFLSLQAAPSDATMAWLPLPALLTELENFALRELEKCWTINLPCVYDLVVWLCSVPYPSAGGLSESDSEGEDDTSAETDEQPKVHRRDLLKALFLHQNDVGAKQQTRLLSMVYAALRVSLPYEPDWVLSHLKREAAVSVTSLGNARTKKNGAAAVKHQSQREVYFAAATVSLVTLDLFSSPPPEGSLFREAAAEHWWSNGLQELLLHWAVFYSPPRDAENESTQAVTESVVAMHWPEALRRRYPASVNLALLGRTLCVSTLLWYAAHHTSSATSSRTTEPHQDAAEKMVMELIALNTTHPVLTSEPCMPNSETHRCRLRVWQLINALRPLLSRDVTVLRPVFEKVASECIPLNNLGSVRRFMEVFCIELLQAQPSLFRALDPYLGNYQLRPQVMGTFVLIAGHTLLHHEKSTAQKNPTGNLAEEEEEEVFRVLFPRLLQQSTSHQHLLRIISHIAIHKIGEARRERLASRTLPPLSAGVKEVFEYICQAEEHVKFREKHEAMLFYDTSKMTSPRSLFCLQRKEANMVLCDAIPAAMFERMQQMETEVSAVIGARFAFERLRVRRVFGGQRTTALLRDAFQGFPFIPHTEQVTNLCADYTTEAIEALWSDPLGEKMKLAEHGAAEDNIQRKTLSWWTSEVHNELHPRALRSDARGSRRHHSVVVVTSLLENPVNVAGLCRCADIFAIEQLVVEDPAVFEHPHFVAVARSAERWVPWQAVAVPGLPAYLASMRAEGYTVIGIEQTAQSVSIEQFDFPQRSVLVLGSEGQGIPAPLIPLLDVCVEIPQYGLIRSLNVHVTGAVAMYEYTLQHVMRKANGE